MRVRKFLLSCKFDHRLNAELLLLQFNYKQKTSLACSNSVKVSNRLIMIRFASSFSKCAGHNIKRKNVVETSRCAMLSSTSVLNSNANDGEPNFLEMVSIYAQNAHAITLKRLLEKKPAPGKKQEDPSIREKHIKGRY